MSDHFLGSFITAKMSWKIGRSTGLFYWAKNVLNMKNWFLKQVRIVLNRLTKFLKGTNWLEIGWLNKSIKVRKYFLKKFTLIMMNFMTIFPGFSGWWKQQKGPFWRLKILSKILLIPIFLLPISNPDIKAKHSV